MSMDTNRQFTPPHPPPKTNKKKKKKIVLGGPALGGCEGE